MLGAQSASAEEVRASAMRSAVSVLDCGAAGDGEQDDTKAIQKALDSEKNVYFPDGRYRVSETLRVNTLGQALMAEGRNQGHTLMRSAGIIPTADFKGPVFHISTHATVFLGLTISGPGRMTDVTALHFESQVNTDDVDGRIFGCVIKSFGTGVKIFGRGMRLEGNCFAVTRNVLDIDWPTEGLKGEGFQMLPYGMRAFYLINNRIHSCNTFIVNEGPSAEHMWGLCATGNLIDVGDALFRGSASYSSFAGNVVCHSRITAFHFNRRCCSTAITGNVISGSDIPDSFRKQPPYGIAFGGECRNVSISGNTFAHISKDAILFDADTQEHVVINGNTFDHTGFDDPADRGTIRFAKPAENIAINGNSFRPGSDGAEAIIYAKGQSLSGCQIVGNVHTAEKRFVTEYKDGGRNVVQDSV